MIVESFSSLAAELYMPTDKALVGEVAPAMLKKLRDDGQGKGALFGALISLLYFFNGMLKTEEAVYYAPVIVIFALGVLPWYFGRRAVWTEVCHRRQHGKWRWER